MAKGAYIGVSAVARKVKKIYIGVGGVARKVKKAYIGVNGVARLWWSGSPTAVTILGSYYHSLMTETPILMYRGVGNIPTSYSAVTDPLASNTSLTKWILYDKANERFVLITGLKLTASSVWTSNVYTMPVDGTTWTSCGTIGAQSYLVKPWIDDEGNIYTIMRKSNSSSDSPIIKVSKGSIVNSSATYTQKEIYTDSSNLWTMPFNVKKVGDYYMCMVGRSGPKYLMLFYANDFNGTWTYASIDTTSTGIPNTNTNGFIDFNYQTPFYYVDGKYVFIMTAPNKTQANNTYTYVFKSDTLLINNALFPQRANRTIIDMGPTTGTDGFYAGSGVCGPYEYGTKIVYSQGRNWSGGSTINGRTGYIDLSDSTPSLVLTSTSNGISLYASSAAHDSDYDSNKLIGIGYAYINASTQAYRLYYTTDLVTWTVSAPTNINKLCLVACSKTE